MSAEDSVGCHVSSLPRGRDGGHHLDRSPLSHAQPPRVEVSDGSTLLARSRRHTTGRVIDLGRPATAISSLLGGGARRAAAAIVLLLLLVAALAGSLSDTAHGTASLQGTAASIALTIAVTVVGIVIVVFTGLILYGLATSPRGSSAANAPVRRPFWRGALVALVIPIIVGILLLLHRRKPNTAATRITSSSSPVRPSGNGHSSVHFVASASVGTVAVVVVLVLALLGLAWWQARHRGRDWNLGELLADRNAGRPFDSSSRLGEVLATVRVADPEEETDPRRAVVAAYVAMTQAAAEAGAERRSDETPAEFLRRLLSSLGASHEAARRLTYLFETARYSTRPFEETLRFDAIAALRQIQNELRDISDSTSAGVTGSDMVGAGVVVTGAAGAGVAGSSLNGGGGEP